METSKKGKIMREMLAKDYLEKRSGAGTAALLAVAKAHFLGHHGHKIPFLRRVLAPIYRSAAHAGLKAGLAGEKGLHGLTRQIPVILEPHVAKSYEKAYTVGRALREQGIKPGMIHKDNVQPIKKLLDRLFPDVSVRKFKRGKEVGPGTFQAAKGSNREGGIAVGEHTAKLLGYSKPTFADKVETKAADLLKRLRGKEAPPKGRTDVSNVYKPVPFSESLNKSTIQHILSDKSFGNRAARFLTQPVSVAFGRKKDPYAKAHEFFPPPTIKVKTPK
tara:strand:- start:6140 stop:6964 length:825 start_codon:yes stop_codon:yes gene_type:complete